MKKLLLISGGIDSLTIYAQKKDQINECIYFDYGQLRGVKEQETKLLNKLKIDYKSVLLDDLKYDSKMFFYGRNLRFIIKIREMFIDENILVYFGNNADDNFSDNSREYLYRLEQLINNSYPPKALRIICPFENMSKMEVIKENQKYYGSLIGYWCDIGGDKPCMKCHSCESMINPGIL